MSKEKATNFDYEAELVIVIGRTARNVSEADAEAATRGFIEHGERSGLLTAEHGA